MGQDKGLLSFHDKPLLFYALETASMVADEIILILRDDDQLKRYKDMIKKFKLKTDLRIYLDEIIDKGPLMGIYIGLKNIGSDRALVVPCDSPLVKESYINNSFSFYDDEYESMVPQWPDGRIEPLHAIYNKSITGKIKKLLNEDKRDVRSLFEISKVKYVEVKSLDESTRSFWNLNRPEDLKNLK